MTRDEHEALRRLRCRAEPKTGAFRQHPHRSLEDPRVIRVDTEYEGLDDIACSLARRLHRCPIDPVCALVQRACRRAEHAREHRQFDCREMSDEPHVEILE